MTHARRWLILRYYEDIAMVNPGQFLLAFELYQLTVEAIIRRFDHQRLTEIHALIPLEPATAAQVERALATLATRTDT